MIQDKLKPAKNCLTAQHCCMKSKYRNKWSWNFVWI